MIYLDYNASTPLDPRVRDQMLPYLNEWFGNPSAPHAMGRTARDAVDRARAQVAAMLGAEHDEIVFTASGTEANNAAVKGLTERLRSRGRHIITSAIEHPSVLNPCRFLQDRGYEVTVVGVDGTGLVDPDAVRRAMRSDTALVSIMHANNEVGTIQPIRAIADAAHERGALMHADAAQTAGKIRVNVGELGVDALSVAGHKLYAPQGVGALFLRKGLEFEPLLHGAGHESGRRAGTEAVAMIVGLGVACDLATSLADDPASRQLRDDLHNGLKAAYRGDLRLHGHPELRLPNTLNVGFVGVRAADVLERMLGVCATAGAACHGHGDILSPVLVAMGVPEESGRGAIRFSVGRPTTRAEITAATRLIAEAANDAYSTRTA